MTIDAPAAAPALTPARARRATVPRATRVDFWLDLAIFVAFVLDESFRFTGVPIHEWVGVGLAVAIPVHVTLHWDWVVRTTKRLVGRRKGGREALRWVVDLLLLPVMTLCVASGLYVSQHALPALGVHPNAGDGFWRGLHSTSADVTLALGALHVALSWRWIAVTWRRITARAAT